MSHILNHFSLQAAKWNSTVVTMLLVVWLALLACAISSIQSQPFDRKQRVFWILLVIVLPVFGVLAYLPFAFQKEDLPHMFLRKSKRALRRDRAAEKKANS